MTKSELETYTGNLRIANICFDTLTQTWEGNKEEYDPKEDEPLAKFYIGKIGKYEPDTYIYNDYLRCACINVIFANGYSVMVGPDDVVATDEDQTWEEILPKVLKPDEDTNIYKTLTDEQKEFADKMFLQLIDGQHQLFNKDFRTLFSQSISMAQYRTKQHSLHWDVTWMEELDDE